MTRSSAFTITFTFSMVMAGCGGSGVGESQFAVGGALQQVMSFGSNPAGLRMWKYVPSSAPPNAPLVVALHACTQQAADYAHTGWNQLADQYGFYVLYPEQNSTNNALECFNWAGSNTNPLTGDNDPSNLTRGEGENLSIKQMVDQMKMDHSIDAARVFVTGLSGGGAETPLLLATWPDVFAAGATFAGIPYYCTINRNQVTTCLSGGITHTPQEWGDLVRQKGDSGFTGSWPRISIWQGTNDSVVSTKNQDYLVAQWTNVHGIGQTPTTSDTVAGVARAIYADPTGAPVVMTYKVPMMDHGVPIDPKHGCGTAQQYILDVGVCGAYWVGVDWGIIPSSSAGGDGGPTLGSKDDGGTVGAGGSGGAGGGGGSGGGASGSDGGVKKGPTSCSGCGVVGGTMGADALLMMVALVALSRRRRRA
jgi:poly(hydroxyalkanoate) depolymerase family esterase